jgi:hypothetical protein
LLDRVDRTTSPIHIGNLRNAIDFIVPEFTPVLAAANGIVSYVKDDSTIGGPNPIYQKYTNFITGRIPFISFHMHPYNGSYSWSKCRE